jgi:hypothetical protein
LASIKAAEEKLDHPLIMGTDESKAYWHIVAKDTPYDYHPELDADVKTTWKNINKAEDDLGVKFEDANLL